VRTNAQRDTGGPRRIATATVAVFPHAVRLTPVPGPGNRGQLVVLVKVAQHARPRGLDVARGAPEVGEARDPRLAVVGVVGAARFDREDDLTASGVGAEVDPLAEEDPRGVDRRTAGPLAPVALDVVHSPIAVRGGVNRLVIKADRWGGREGGVKRGGRLCQSSFPHTWSARSFASLLLLTCRGGAGTCTGAGPCRCRISCPANV
jgi:hypothetical protein